MKLFKKSLLLSTVLFLQIVSYAQHTKSKWIALVTSINEAYISSVTADEKLFRGDDSRIEFTGRVEYSKGQTPKFWAPGVYFTTRFQGDECEIILEDEVLYGTSHNYIELVVDGSAIRLEMVDRYNSIKIANLSIKNTAYCCAKTRNPALVTCNC